MAVPSGGTMRPPVVDPGILTSPWNLPQLEKPGNPETGGSVGSGEDLLDFTQSDMTSVYQVAFLVTGSEKLQGC
jgi:hypothetical protein